MQNKRKKQLSVVALFYIQQTRQKQTAARERLPEKVGEFKFSVAPLGAQLVGNPYGTCENHRYL